MIPRINSLPLEPAAPAIRVDHSACIHSAANNPLQGWLRAVRHNLGIDLPIALENAKDNRLATGPTAPFSLNPPCAEEALVNLNDAKHRALRLAGPQEALTQDTVEPIDGIAVQAGSSAVCRAVRSAAKYRAISRILASEILERAAYLFLIVSHSLVMKNHQSAGHDTKLN